MGRITSSVLVAAAALSCSAAVLAQFGTGLPTETEAHVDGPAPARDLAGVWTRIRPEGQFYSNSAWTPEPPALTEWGQERFATAKDSNAGSFSLSETNDPVLTRCYPPGVPRVYFHPYPFEIIYTAKEMIMLYEYDHTIRRVYVDGRPNPEDPVMLWLGNSVGEWQDDTTFVVTTVGIDERTWLDRSGYQHSDQLKVTETFNRIDQIKIWLFSDQATYETVYNYAGQALETDVTRYFSKLKFNGTVKSRETNLFGTKKRHPCQFGKGLGGYIFHIPLRKTFHFEIDGFPATSEDGKIQHDPSGYKLVFYIGSKYLAGFQEKIYEYYAMYEKKMLTYNEDKRKRMKEKRLIAKNSKIK